MPSPVSAVPGCNVQCSALSPEMVARWWALQGTCWTPSPGHEPYFNYCVKHHLVRWPSDKRTNNRHSKPSTNHNEGFFFGHRNGGICKSVAGDFYLTRAPPFEVAPQETHADAAPPVEAPRAKRMRLLEAGAAQQVTWADDGKWQRTIGERTQRQRNSDLRAALRSGLVEMACPALDIDRRHDYKRTGPCDGCCRPDVHWQPKGKLLESEFTTVLQLCMDCAVTFNRTSYLMCKEFNQPAGTA